MPKKATVEIHLGDDDSSVGFHVSSEDGDPLTCNEILDAIADALLYYWEGPGFTPRKAYELNS